QCTDNAPVTAGYGRLHRQILSPNQCRKAHRRSMLAAGSTTVATTHGLHCSTSGVNKAHERLLRLCSRANMSALTLSSNQAEKLNRARAGGTEPVWRPGVEFCCFSCFQEQILIAKDQT